MKSMQTLKRAAVIVNAEGLILGRMSSKVAKLLLNGEQVIIINAEKAIISGKRQAKIEEAHKFLEVGAPKRGPFHYRRPDRIVVKTVRGMLPAAQPKGKKALSNLRVFLGIPEELKTQKTETLKDAQSTDLRGPKLTLGELAKAIGWNQGE